MTQEIKVGSEWYSKEDNSIRVIVRNKDETHVLIEFIGEMTTPRGSMYPRPHRDMLSNDRFIELFTPLDVY